MLSYITGSNGFIGSRLLPKLQGDIIPLPHDVIQSTHIEPFDYFYFLSSYGNLNSQTDEDQIYKANIEDLLSILKQIRNYQFKSFVFVSTSSVALKTQTTYSRMKRAAEEILFAFMERHDLPVCIIRPFSVTGVGEQEEHLIPTLLAAADSGKHITLAPTPTHDFIDVDDVAEGIVSLATHKARGIYQLGTGTKFTNFEVLKMVEEQTGKKINVTMVGSLRPYDNDNWVSTNYKARSYGWMPKKQLTQSIKEMYEATL